LKIVFSRKGFDSSSGRAPSPIINGAPITLPIPTGKYPSVSTYGDLDLGDIVSKANKNYAAGSPCHEDPMFWDDRCAFGQTSAAQSHLANHAVGVGDVFLFFGLFAEGGRYRHHRIFGYLNVERVFKIGAHPTGEGLWRALDGAPRQHLHTIAKWDSGGKWDDNNTIYVGRGGKAKNAHKLSA
jgi:Nucleotide modification associated domain 3